MSKKIDPQVINERLRALRRLMQEKGIMVYVVPTSDASYFRVCRRTL